MQALRAKYKRTTNEKKGIHSERPFCISITDFYSHHMVQTWNKPFVLMAT